MLYMIMCTCIWMYNLYICIDQFVCVHVCTFFWSGLPKDACHIHDVGFVVRILLLRSYKKSLIAIDEQLMTLSFPLAC